MAHKLTQQRDAVVREAHKVNKALHPAKRDRYGNHHKADQSALQYDALRFVKNTLQPPTKAAPTGTIFYSRTESNKPWMIPPGFLCEVDRCEVYVTDLPPSKKPHTVQNYPVGKKAMSAFIRRSQEKIIQHLLDKHRSAIIQRCSTCQKLLSTSLRITVALRRHCRDHHLSREARPDHVPQHLAQRVTALVPLYDKYNITLLKERLELARRLDKAKTTQLLQMEFPNPGVQSNNSGWKMPDQLPIFECGGRMLTVLAPAVNTLKDSDYSPNHVNKDAYCSICDFQLGDGSTDDYESMSRRHKHWLGTSIINDGINFESLQLGRYWIGTPSDIGCTRAQLDQHKKAGAYLKTQAVICQAHKLRFVSPAETWKHWRECHRILEDEIEVRALWPDQLQIALDMKS